GGLSVPGDLAEDHPLDLPQAFLGKGALVYLANSGYGWGLELGVGYSERLVELFTAELTAGGTVGIGDAVREAKLPYFLPIPRSVPSSYDEKTLLQWSLFGLPMYEVRTGVGAAAGDHLAAGLPASPPPSAAREHLGPIAVERQRAATRA